MRRYLDWVITVLYLPLFFGILSLFHLPIVFAHKISAIAQQRILEVMNYFLLLNLRVTAGARFHLNFHADLPQGRPVIVVANHQSMYDIPLFVWELRQIFPRFIAKRELGKGFPSISFHLRTQCALIDRGNALQAKEEIKRLGREVYEKRQSIVIFPEGTRARDGKLKKFKSGGFTLLLEEMPDAVILPVAISGAWKLLQFNLLPIPYGVDVHFDVLPAVSRDGHSPTELLEKIEVAIKSTVEGYAEKERREYRPAATS